METFDNPNVLDRMNQFERSIVEDSTKIIISVSNIQKEEDIKNLKKNLVEFLEKQSVAVTSVADGISLIGSGKVNVVKLENVPLSSVIRIRKNSVTSYVTFVSILNCPDFIEMTYDGINFEKVAACKYYNCSLVNTCLPSGDHRVDAWIMNSSLTNLFGGVSSV